jgi:hypothetical protein
MFRSSPANPRIVSLSLSLTVIVLTLPMLLTGLFPNKLKVPFRVSSLPSWKPLPPFAYFYVEDVVAVDGGGCTEFRQAWRVRYEESLPMRRHIRNVSLYWGISGCALGGVLVATAWVAPTDTAYGLSWSMPWLWIMLSGFAQIVWTNRLLVQEREQWHTSVGHVEKALPFKDGPYDPRASMLAILRSDILNFLPAAAIIPLARVATFDPAILRHLSEEHPEPLPRANSDPAPARNLGHALV